jgi:hypothetical protein
MAIRIPKMPYADSYEAIARYLERPHARPLLSDLDLENLGASDPFPVYIATLDELVAGVLPKLPNVWRHLLVNEAGAVGEAELDPAEPDDVVAMHRGPRAAGTARAIEEAESFERAQRQDYELRMLESPAIHLVSVWLHGSNDDVLIPVEPDMTGLPLHQPVSHENAQSQLRQLAEFAKSSIRDNPGPSGN